MKVAYHFMIPRPPVPELDGAVQEAIWLRDHFGGSIHYLYPTDRFRRWLPSGLCGVRQLAELRSLDREVDLHHLFSPGLRAYPALRGLSRPLVYTLLTGLDEAVRPGRSGFWSRLSEVVAPDAHALDLLTASGLPRVVAIPPGIELESFSSVRKPPGGEEFVLLAGSAPWSVGQFATKGFDMLLEVASELPWLRLVLLWRGALHEEIARRVASAGLGERVEIHQETVAVAETLGGVHAAVALARGPRLLKAYPHSLLEALAAGRPIVTSAGLAIGDLVRETGAGVVLERHDRGSLREALERLRSDYPAYRERTERLDLAKFSRQRFLASYEAVYRRAVSEGAGR